jgi:hypothetical protein
MKKTRFSDEQMDKILREADKAPVCRQITLSSLLS